MLGSATKRNSKYPIHTIEIHPSRNRDAEMEYYPETRDYTAVDKDWEGKSKRNERDAIIEADLSIPIFLCSAVQRSLKSLPP